MTKWALYFILAIAINLSGVMASKVGEEETEKEMSNVGNKKSRPKLVFPPSLACPPDLITASESLRGRKFYYNRGRGVFYFRKKQPQSLVIFGKSLRDDSESTPSYLKVGEIFYHEEEGHEEEEFIKFFDKIDREGSVVQLTNDNIEFYKNISYSESILPLSLDMSIGVMRKFEGQTDQKLIRRMNFTEELSVLNQ